MGKKLLFPRRENRIEKDENEAILNLIGGAEGVFNCFEEGDFFRSIIGSGRYTQRGLADRIGKSQSYVCNKMRLSRLGPSIRKKIIDNGLTERHARQILRISDEKVQKIAVEYTSKHHLTVEKLEKWVNDLLGRVNRNITKSYRQAAEKYHNAAKHKEKSTGRGSVAYNTECLRELIKAVAQLVEVARKSGLVVSAGQRNTDMNVELVIRVPRAENSVSLKSGVNQAPGKDVQRREKDAA